jgi:hypothetical protein
MDLVDAAIVNAGRRLQAQRRNNAVRLNASTRCQKFVRIIEDCSKARGAKGSAFSLVSLEERILQSVNDEPRKTVHGDYLFNDIVSTINGFRKGTGELFVLRLDQQKMVAFILTCCLPMIYRHELEVHKKRILSILKTHSIYEMILILASRRVGKTTCIAAATAALMICKPEITATIFANVKKSSKRVMEAIIGFLNMDPRGRALLAAKTTISNQDELKLVDPQFGTQKMLEIYAATTNVRPHSFLAFSLLFLLRYVLLYLRTQYNGLVPRIDDIHLGFDARKHFSTVEGNRAALREAVHEMDVLFQGFDIHKRENDRPVQHSFR